MLQQATETPDPGSLAVGVLGSLESVSERWAQRGERVRAAFIEPLLSVLYDTSVSEFQVVAPVGRLPRAAPVGPLLLDHGDDGLGERGLALQAGACRRGVAAGACELWRPARFPLLAFGRCQRSYPWSLLRVRAGACPGSVGCGRRRATGSSRLIMSMLDRLAESRIVRSPPELTAARMAARTWGAVTGPLLLGGWPRRTGRGLCRRGGLRTARVGGDLRRWSCGWRACCLEVDLEAGVAVGLEGSGGLGPEPGGGGAARDSDRVVEVVGEHGGGFALGAL